MSDHTASSLASNANAFKIGDAWGDDITEDRRRELDAILAAWEAESDHGGRKSPFDRYRLERDTWEEAERRRLTSADVFYLATRAIIGSSGNLSDMVDAIRASLRDPASGAIFLFNLASLHLERADLQGANLERANLGRVYLEDANLEGARLTGANLAEAKLSHVNFEHAQLDRADLSLADLERANLNQTLLRGANLWGAKLEHARLREAQLDEADLTAAHLEGAALHEASLAHANLSEVWLDAGTVLTDVKLGVAGRDSVRVADVRWGGVNLAVVDWSPLIEPVTQLGDEREARAWKPTPFKPSKERASRKERASERQRHFEKQHQERLEMYRAAVRANRQLATALREQGMNEEADAFAYRAQVVQRSVFAQQGKRGRATLSWFLDMVAGHGYKPARSLYTYLGVLFGFAFLFFLVGNGWLTFGLGVSQYENLPWYEALILSVSSFHGRGFFQPLQTLGDPVAIIASVEAVFGLFIEVAFIATFTQRFFGK
jgi:uncharacterized protein YjbI with pentapeptide repeats